MSVEEADALLGRVAQGQVQAMEAFYRMFERTIYRYALSRLSDPFDAAEVLNDVMLDVWRQASRFEGRSAVSTWLIGITRHKVIDRQRLRGKHEWEELSEELEDEQPQAAVLVEQAQEAERMRSCVQKLGPNHREVVHLAFFEDWSQEQIATLMQCPPGTVKSRMYHAKEALKKCLERWMNKS